MQINIFACVILIDHMQGDKTNYNAKLNKFKKEEQSHIDMRALQLYYHYWLGYILVGDYSKKKNF